MGPVTSGTRGPPGLVAAASLMAAVTATSASNVWAVGSDLGGVIVQHWNGTVWK